MLTVNLTLPIFLEFGKKNHQHIVTSKFPNFYHFTTIIAGDIMVGVFTKFLLNQITLLLFPGILNTDTIISPVDTLGNGRFILTFTRFIHSISTRIGFCYFMPKNTSKMYLTRASIREWISPTLLLTKLIHLLKQFLKLLFWSHYSGNLNNKTL